MTIDSPAGVGSVATRRSIPRPFTTMLIRPSCGRRRSAMSISAMILTRLITPALHREREAA